MGWSNGPKTWSELNARLSDGRRRVTSPRPGAESASGSAQPPGRASELDEESAADGFNAPVLERHGRVVPIATPGRVDNIPPIAESPGHPSVGSSGSRFESGASSRPGSPIRTGSTSESGWRPGRARAPQQEPQPQSQPQPQQAQQR
jgi:hypothetical protein